MLCIRKRDPSHFQIGCFKLCKVLFLIRCEIPVFIDHFLQMFFYF